MTVIEKAILTWFIVMLTICVFGFNTIHLPKVQLILKTSVVVTVLSGVVGGLYCLWAFA